MSYNQTAIREVTGPGGSSDGVIILILLFCCCCCGSSCIIPLIIFFLIKHGKIEDTDFVPESIMEKLCEGEYFDETVCTNTPEPSS
jgi:hypothetical protein